MPARTGMSAPRQPGMVRSDERGMVLSGPLALLSVAAVVLAGVAFVVTGDHGDRSVERADPSAATAPAHGAASSAAASGAQGSKASGTGKTATETAGSKKTPDAKAQDSKAQKSRAHKAKARKARHQHAEPAVRRAETYVEVYNNSGISGLAGATASKISGAGWQVVGSDNWYGTIPATTVYYPARLEPQAKLLAKDLGIVRLRPAIAPMRFDRLTVILTGDYA